MPIRTANCCLYSRPDQPDVTARFELHAPEARTWDYPGSAGGVSILEVWDAQTGQGMQCTATELDALAECLAERIAAEEWDRLQDAREEGRVKRSF